jgi:hypothetical protein
VTERPDFRGSNEDNQENEEESNVFFSVSFGSFVAPFLKSGIFVSSVPLRISRNAQRYSAKRAFADSRVLLTNGFS